jgi:PIN domain nuclease of toxin-antitoxin system
MKLLLDTHIWLWYLFDNPKLPRHVATEIANPGNELWLSPITIWETLLLEKKGRITLSPNPRDWINNALQTVETREAFLNHAIAVLSRQIDCPHEDPADRFIAATAIYYNLNLATVDQNLIDTPSLITQADRPRIG